MLSEGRGGVWLVLGFALLLLPPPLRPPAIKGQEGRRRGTAYLQRETVELCTIYISFLL